MTTVVTDFGTFDVAERDIVTFPAGLPGFEHARRFVVLAAPDLAPLKRLQSIEDASVSFVVVDPRLVEPSFQYPVNDQDWQPLLADRGVELVWLCMIVVGPDGAVTANLAAPVVIDPVSMRALQLLRADPPYSFAHPVLAAEEPV